MEQNLYFHFSYEIVKVEQNILFKKKYSKNRNTIIPLLRKVEKNFYTFKI